MNQRRLIVNADDLGMTEGITDGIIFAHRYGIVTSASLLVNQPASEYALEQAKNIPTLGVGVHVNVDEGVPLLPPARIPSLVDEEGKLYSQVHLISRLWRRQVLASDLEAEFRAQINWVKQHGVTPTHCDSHHHIHFYPHAARAFTRACQAEGVRWIRVPRVRHYPRNGYIGGPHAGPVYRRLLVTLYMELLQLTRFRHLKFPDCRVESDPAYDVEEKITRGWHLALENLPPGTYELVCHPGFGRGNDDNQGFPGYSSRRDLEVSILTAPEFRSLLQRWQIALVNYAEM